MYDMGAASRSGLKNALTLEQRKRILAEAAEQRYAEFTGGETAYTGGTADELTENSTPVEREFYAFYRTPRGEFTPEGATHRTTTHPTLASNVKFMNFYPFNDIGPSRRVRCSSSSGKTPIRANSARTPSGGPPSRKSCMPYRARGTSISTTARG